jgi:hypothetical protein
VLSTKVFSRNHLAAFATVSILLVVFIRIICKAATTSFTHDESITYLYYVTLDFMDILSFKNPFTNNHILNTILMKVCEILFGNSEFSLRLPNVLAFILFAIYSWKILDRQKSVFTLFFICILVLHPHLLDFFSLARGYGLSFGLMTMSLFYLLRSIETPRGINIVLMNASALLATLSNFTLLNYYVAALLAFNMWFLLARWVDRSNQYSFWRLNKVNLFMVLVSGIVLYQPLRKIMKQRMLDFGGKNGFFVDTVGGFTRNISFDTLWPDIIHYTLIVFFTLIPVIGLVYILAGMIRKNKEFVMNQPLMIISSILITAIFISCEMQHFLLNSDFYIERFSLFLYPLFVFCLFSIVVRRTEGNTTTFSPSFLFFFFIAVAMIINYTITYKQNFFLDWKYDMQTKQAMSDLEKEHLNNKNQNAVMGVSWVLEPAANYYRIKNKMNWLSPVNRDKPDTLTNDYIFIFTPDTDPVMIDGKPVISDCVEACVVMVKNK